jgi:hypothetical protein
MLQIPSWWLDAKSFDLPFDKDALLGFTRGIQVSVDSSRHARL